MDINKILIINKILLYNNIYDDNSFILIGRFGSQNTKHMYIRSRDHNCRRLFFYSLKIKPFTQ